MENLLRDATLRPHMASIDFQGLLGRRQGTLIGPQTAKHLVRFLISKTGLKTEDFQPRLTREAKVALETLFYFIKDDRDFQKAFEALHIRDLMKKLKLHRHILEGPPEHSAIAVNLTIFLSTNSIKFSNWRLYVRKVAYPAVLEGLAHILPSTGPPAPLPMLHGEEEGMEDVNASVVEVVPMRSKSPHMRQYGHENLPPLGSLFCQCDSDEVERIFDTSRTHGLTSTEVNARREKYGPNELPRTPPPKLIVVFLRQFMDFIILMFLAITVLELAMQKWIPAGILVGVIMFQITVGFVQELKAQKALKALENYAVQHATVLRAGETKVVEASELVPGDIVKLDEGNVVPADLRLFEVANLQIIEAVLTGESVSVEKSIAPIMNENVALVDVKNVAFMSTTVTRGRGVGIVTSTGKATEVGKISKAVGKPKEPKTLLQKKIDKLGKVLVFIAIGLVLLVVAILLLRRGLRIKLVWKDVLDAIEIGLGLSVSCIPEGLSAVVTVSMALGVARMAKKNAVVKRLAVVEALGSVTTICSDKTGTLSEGRMRLEEIRTCDTVLKFAKGSTEIVDGEGRPLDLANPSPEVNYTFMYQLQAIPEEGGEPEITAGDPTEGAILVAAEKARLGKVHWAERGWKTTGELPFDSDRKRMSVLVRNEDSTMMLMKGAPEAVVLRCTSRSKDGRVDPLTEEMLERIKQSSQDMAFSGLRVLALAYRHLPHAPVPSNRLEEVENDMTFLSLIGLFDPPRDGVREAIAVAKKAGIRVCMITGDHPHTALAIADQLGIANKNDPTALMRGSEIEAFSDIGTMAALHPFPCVFARVNPDHKLKIVQALKQRKEVCAMTGDGVNDAPAIRQADVGVAMGISGTDLTKDCADFILTDDNFTTIVEAIREGRHIFDLIKGFTVYLLSTNISEVLVMLACAIFDFPVAFTSIMILCVNLVINVPPSIALGVEKPRGGIMDRKPRNPKKGILTTKATALLAFQGLVNSSITFLIYTLTLALEEPEALAESRIVRARDASSTMSEASVDGLRRCRSVAVLVLGCLFLVQAFMSRTIHGSMFRKDLFNNYFLDATVTFSALLLVGWIWVPGMREVFGQLPPKATDLPKIVGACLVQIVLVESFKALLRFHSRRAVKIAKRKGKESLYHDDI